MTSDRLVSAAPPAPGTLIIVGAGPGNPDLLTVRAREVLANTATAFVDDTVHDAITDLLAEELAVPQALIDQVESEYQQACEQAADGGSRKKPARPPLPTAAHITYVEECTVVADPAWIVTAVRPMVESGEDVVRLVTGNPLTNDRVLAEINAVAEAGIDFQIVPGMPVPATVPAFAGIALGSTFTETDLTHGEVDWEQLASGPQPMMLQATAEQLPHIAKQLTSCGLSTTTPASVTVHGATRLQRTFDVTLATLGKLDAELPGTLLVVVGVSVDSRSKYSWWENRALYGWRVLVPRAKEQAGPMSTKLLTHGAIPQEVPTISVEPPRNPAQMERAVKGVVEGRYRWIVLTSVNAVNALWDKMAEFGLDARDLAGVKIAAVGHKTAAAIRDKGISPELTPNPKQQNATGLVAVFPEYDEELDPVSRVLLPRADIAGDTLIDGLIELGWDCDDVTAYRTVRAAPPSAEIREMIKSGGFDAVCFTSPSTVKNLIGIAGKPHQRTINACIGPSTAAAAEELGLRVDVIPEHASVIGLVDALADHVAALRAAGQLPPPKKKRRARRKTAS
ncbi:uroporphyrinogen-III synthase [Corynebacterium choanae]|uniref:uroporphyrinogen-III C-methyltransferase n=1 Tax=Corynebacterium choanae TaxID=1862358 RepID=A0A3G6J997_9CORY|nr:uroporphyrinogen-III synthase [Corynebacterium choanae]AZA14479.1 Uroporphyrinogen-III C-methyltransferase [Corynebacterium choanae]